MFIELCTALTEPPQRTLEGITLDGLDNLKHAMERYGRALVLTASGPRLLSLPLALTADFGLRTSSACLGELPHRHARVATGAPDSWLADMVYRRQAAQKIPSSSTGMNSWLAMAAVLLVACAEGAAVQ